MGLFGKKEKKSCCCGGGNETQIAKKGLEKDKTNGIIILGSGCAKCNQLERNTREALEELGREDNIEHITDFAQIAAYGIMSTPALVINGKVKCYGKVLNKSEIVDLLKNE